MIAAVTGATGYAGQFIVRRLLTEGIRVRAWFRPGSDISILPGSVEWIEGDLRNPSSMDALVSGADMLVHAALEHVPARYRGGEGNDLAAFIGANVGGSLRLLELARHAGVHRAVFLSSRAVFGSAPRPGPIGDGDALAPDTHYGAAKAAVEAFVQSWGAEGWSVAALRPTGIYGVVEPFERTKWRDLVAGAVRGEPVAQNRAATEVHGEDVAEAVWLLLTAAPLKVAGRGFNCSDRVVSTRDIIQAVQEASGRPELLPEPTSDPANMMACAALEALGMRFGGLQLLQRTVGEIAERCRS